MVRNGKEFDIPSSVCGHILLTRSCSYLIGYATSFFTPTIITELGFKAEAAQVRSIPIFIVATVVALTTAWFTDRLRHRYAFCITGCCIATIGYSILLYQASVSVEGRYAAIFLIVSGGYMCPPVTVGWISNCMGGHYKRSISSAMQAGLEISEA